MKKIFTIILVLAIALISTATFAQPGFPDFVDDETTAPAAPIVGLLPLAIAVGAVIGIKKLK